MSSWDEEGAHALMLCLAAFVGHAHQHALLRRITALEDSHVMYVQLFAQLWPGRFRVVKAALPTGEETAARLEGKVETHDAISRKLFALSIEGGAWIDWLELGSAQLAFLVLVQAVRNKCKDCLAIEQSAT